MPTIVEIPDVGEVEFPDSMSPDEVQRTSARLYAESQGQGVPAATQARRESLATEMAHPAQAAPRIEPLSRTAVRGAAQGVFLGAGDEAAGAAVAAARRPVEAAGGIARFLGSLEPSIGGPLSPMRAPVAEAPDPLTGETRPAGDIAAEVAAEERAGLARGRSEPVGATIGALTGVAGGLVTANPVLRGLQTLRVPTQGGRGAVATGAATGAVAGALSAPPGERLVGAGIGAATGAGVGAVASPLLGLRALTGRQPADRLLRQIQEQTGMTPDQIEAALHRLGPRATLADVAENFKAAGDVAAGRLGPMAEKVREFIARDEAAFGRLMAPIRRSLGSAEQAAGTVKELREIKKRIASPLYDRAFSRPVDVTERLDDILARPVVQAAWRRVQREGASDLSIDVSQLADVEGPSFRGWQQITEELWQRRTQLMKAGRKKSAQVPTDIRRAILAELDGQSPDFRQARAIWADTSVSEDALDAGREFLKLSPSDLAEVWDDLDEAARPFFRVGAARSIEERLATVADTSETARALRNQAFRDKARVIFEDEADAESFIDAVATEARFKDTANSIGRNSRTEIRRVVGRQLGTEEMGETPVTLLSAARTVARGLGLRRGPSEKQIQNLGQLVLSQRPEDKRRALSIMRQVFDSPLSELAATARVGAAGVAAGEASRRGTQ